MIDDPQTIEAEPRPCWVAGSPEQGARQLAVRHPYDGTEVAEVAVPSQEQIERAVATAASTARRLRDLPAHQRAAALSHVAMRIRERAEEIAEIITAESGKPLALANIEITRATNTFTVAARLAHQPDDDLRGFRPTPDGNGRLTLLRRRPRGPVLAITSALFPLNLVAHKVAPAIAVGAPVIVKPDSATPMSALLLGEILAETELPAGAFSVLPLVGEALDSLAADPRLPVISFSGTKQAATAMLDSFPYKRIVRDTTQDNVVILGADWSGEAELRAAADRVATGGGPQGGQSCLGARRVIVHRSLEAGFRANLTVALRALHTGDPYDPEVNVGPLIDEATARRVEEHINAAVAAGSTLVAGGGRNAATIEPTILTDVPTDIAMPADEVPGPVVVLSFVDNMTEAFELVNADAYSPWIGILTHDTRTAFQAAANIDMADVVIGEATPHGAEPNQDVEERAVHATMLAYTQSQTLVFT